MIRQVTKSFASLHTLSHPRLANSLNVCWIDVERCAPCPAVPGCRHPEDVQNPA